MKILLWKAMSRLARGAPVERTLRRLANRFRSRRGSTGEISFPFIERRRENNLQILVYHRVNDAADPFFPAVPVDVFARQMELLAGRYTILGLEEALELLKRRAVPPDAVAVTFDDGYRDNHDCAFPVLEALSIPATIFLATSVIGTGEVLWHDAVFDAFRRTEARVARLDGGGDGAELPLGTVEEKLAAQSRFLASVRLLGTSARRERIAALRARLGVGDAAGGDGERLMLDWDEVRRMAAGGIEFGSHTHRHPILSRLDEEETREELAVSKRRIEEETGRTVTTFAYPNGTPADFNDTTKAVLRELGYAGAVTTIFGSNDSSVDPFELRRGGPWEADPALYDLKMKWYKFVC